LLIVPLSELEFSREKEKKLKKNQKSKVKVKEKSAKSIFFTETNSSPFYFLDIKKYIQDK